MIATKTPLQAFEDRQERNRLISWIKEHKKELLLTGVSITALLLFIVGLKNKEEILFLWNSLKKRIDKGNLFSPKWFEKANLDELHVVRDLVLQDYLNPELDLDYRDECKQLLSRIDNAISRLQCNGKECGYPVHREHGWYLPDKD